MSPISRKNLITNGKLWLSQGQEVQSLTRLADVLSEQGQFNGWVGGLIAPDASGFRLEGPGFSWELQFENILPELKAGESAGHDCSTTGLLNHFISHQD